MKAYEILVEQIIDKLEQGVIPWKQPWVGGIPYNYISKKNYRGFNKLVLSLNDFKDNRYLTIKQVKRLGGSIKKGSKGTKIYYFKMNELEYDDKNSSKTVQYIPMIRYYTVFNIEQIKGIGIRLSKDINDDTTKLYKAQEILSNYKDKPVVKHGIIASYNLERDIITIPSLFKFKSNEEYFSTIFHEMIHSTGSESRLSRFGLKQIEYFGSDRYSKEELIAELGSMFLCMEAGIINETIYNSTNYIAGWLKYIKGNKKDLITASIQAEKAVSYILGTNYSLKKL